LFWQTVDCFFELGKIVPQNVIYDFNDFSNLLLIQKILKCSASEPPAAANQIPPSSSPTFANRTFSMAASTTHHPSPAFALHFLSRICVAALIPFVFKPLM